MERKYNTDFRKKIVSKFEEYKNKKNLIDIYNIISEYTFSSNTNGLFFNINEFSDDCILKLVDYTNNEKPLTRCDCKIEYNTYNDDDTHIGLKNKDKVIIKKYETIIISYDHKKNYDLMPYNMLLVKLLLHQ